jgi:hypothetical protein
MVGELAASAAPAAAASAIPGGAIIAGGAIIGSAIMNWMNSKDAAEATAQERQRVAELFDRIQQPNFDPKDLTPEDYKVVATYVPQVAPYVEAIAPQTVQVTSPDAMQGRNAEKSALENMLAMARSGRDPLSEIAQSRASRKAASDAQSARATLDAQMQRRGVGAGSGLQYAGNQAAISDAFMADALAGEQAAEGAAGRRVQANQQAGNLGSQIYGQEASLAEKNAGIMNDFNKWIRDSKQTWQNQRSNTLNDATMTNFKNVQDTANKNTALANSAKTGRNDMAQQKFDNALSIARGKAGLSDQRVNDIGNNTRQQNTAVQGLGEGIAKIGMYDWDKEKKKDPLMKTEA